MDDAIAVSHKRTVYVGNLDEHVTEDLIRAAFVPFGEILSVNFPFDQYTRFSFVEFESVDDANSAVDNMHNSELLGKVISCSTAKAATIQSKSKAVWEEDSKDQDKTEKDKDQKIKTSDVTVNAGTATKKQKITDFSTLPTPSGFTRCKSCGGWGVGLVKENGHCNHCTVTLKIQ